MPSDIEGLFVLNTLVSSPHLSLPTEFSQLFREKDCVLIPLLTACGKDPNSVATMEAQFICFYLLTALYVNEKESL